MRTRLRLRYRALSWLGTVSALVVGCSTSSSSGDGVPASAGAASVVQGTADGHCGPRLTAIDAATCHATPDGGVSTKHEPVGVSPYGTTMFGDTGDDDDCKYHVRWSASGPKRGVTFTVVAVTKGDGLPARGTPLLVEAFLDETHPAPNTDQRSTETSTPGTYTVGPIAFDVAGRWTVRFHFHAECDDAEQSPHGHAAFYVEVKD